MDAEGRRRGPVGTAPVSVRPARPEDAAAIARVQSATWRTAYRSVLPATVLDEWDDDAAAAAWATAITTPPTERHGVLVALEREIVVGFAAYGPGEDGSHRDGPVELATLLVEPRWGRRGHGSRLLAAVADLTSRDGCAALQAWLPEADRVSARFFESAGWAPAGWVRTLDTGDTPLREILWHTEITEPSATDREVP